jgi:hypothetical protein
MHVSYLISSHLFERRGKDSIPRQHKWIASLIITTKVLRTFLRKPHKGLRFYLCHFIKGYKKGKCIQKIVIISFINSFFFF